MSTASVVRECVVALLGNPNVGKSSLFNQLTGLRQKVGNFPGVTVDKKIGRLQLSSATAIKLIDFPGTYSFYPNSEDERIVVQTLAQPANQDYPDAIVYVADVTQLERHLLLFSQLRDLGLPCLLALNMADVAEKEGITIDLNYLGKKLQVPVVAVSGRTGSGLDQLKNKLSQLLEVDFKAPKTLYQLSRQEQAIAQDVKALFPNVNAYQALLLAHHHDWLPYLSKQETTSLQQITAKHEMESLRFQVNETMQRFDRFTPIVQHAIQRQSEERSGLTERLDRIFTHRFLGPIIFFVLMLLVFQAIYSWATVPMDWIEGLFGWLSDSIALVLPKGWFTSLLTEGIIAGLEGILVFIPQIAVLFFLISLLEEVGYMARAAYLFDRPMQFFGLNGRSIVALISGGACAIPAVMSTRTIGNWKERLITILVTPFISCSARIPVYTVLIGFVVPSTVVWGFFNAQGLAFMGLYLLGIAAALIAAFIFKLILKTNERSYLMLELPEYRLPVMRNVLLTVWEKVKTFTIEAGRVIFVISIILWFLASYGPGNTLEIAEQEARQTAQTQQLDEQATDNLIASRKIEASYAGIMGKTIEPAIAPLGFDWKMGIALITSFAAREVFIGTMAIIYGIGSEEDEEGISIRNRMAQEKDPITGEAVYSMATALSLLLFYVFAMQCMSTLAVVYRETKTWKWPLIQFIFMTALAYLSSLLVYQLLS
ncbi:MAG: ferrous iron transport protein B [Bacteroidota bacterium]